MTIFFPSGGKLRAVRAGRERRQQGDAEDERPRAVLGRVPGGAEGLKVETERQKSVTVKFQVS